jgi:tetratricopeptide (TPR) repeat protein
MREAEPHLAELLIGAGDDGPDVCQSFVQGFFANLRSNDALQLLDAWEESYPHDAQPVFMRAYLWKGMGQNAQAIDLYRRGLALAPNRTKMRRQLAAALIDTGELEEAEKQLAICRAEIPDDAETRFLTARCAHARGDFAETLGRLDETLELAADHLDARRLKGQVHLAEGQSEEALRELQAVIAERPYDTLAREALGRTLRLIGKTDEAKIHFDYVAQAEESIGRMDRLARESILHPNDADLRYEIGSILVRYGPPEDAEKWFRSALEIDPGHVPAQRALATYLNRQGRATPAALSRMRTEPDRQVP